MSNELAKGMYVRTKSGIGKIDKTRYFLGRYEFHLDSNKGTIHNVTDNTYWNTEHNIIGEPSLNPIDLIEVGDYVNGYEVIEKPYIYHDIQFVSVDTQDSWSWGKGEMPIVEIKSIVTKEQFEAMKYEIK